MQEDIVYNTLYGEGKILSSRFFRREFYVHFKSGRKVWLKANEIRRLTQAPIDFQEGDWIIHRTYRTGRVLKIIPVDNDFEIWVEFDQFGIKKLRQSIAGLHKTAPPLDPKPTPGPINNHYFKSRRMIEAFRLGIVPHDMIDEFTFGRDAEISQIEKWLVHDKINTHILVGEYGSGKTHILNYAYWKAIRQGYAAAYVEMDPQECPFYQPKKVYAKFIQSLKFQLPFDKQEYGFKSLLQNLLRDGAFHDHAYFKHLLPDANEKAWEWIEARNILTRPEENGGSVDLDYPPLYNYSSAGNIYCYLLSAIGYGIKKTLGLRGLALIFDEAEAISQTNYGYQVQKADSFLKALIRVASNDEALKRPHSAGLEYCLRGISRNIPFLYRSPSSIKLLFAFTPLTILREITKYPDTMSTELSELSPESKRQLFDRIKILYKNAYNYETESDGKSLYKLLLSKSEKTRAFVKGSVEIYDLIRFNQFKSDG